MMERFINKSTAGAKNFFKVFISYPFVLFLFSLVSLICFQAHRLKTGQKTQISFK